MEFKTLMENRRAVNFFNVEKDLPETTLREIVALAAKTPSGFNLQPWSLMVLRDYQDKLRLQKLSMNQAKISEAPVTLIVLADRDGWKEGHPFVEKNFQENIRAGRATEDKREWFINTLAKLYGKHNDTIQAFACKIPVFLPCLSCWLQRAWGWILIPWTDLIMTGCERSLLFRKTIGFPCSWQWDILMTLKNSPLQNGERVMMKLL